MTTKTLIEVEVPEGAEIGSVVLVSDSQMFVDSIYGKPCDSTTTREFRLVPPARAVPGVDELAQIIRQVDGANSLGAGALAEKIWERMTLTPAGPARQRRLIASTGDDLFAQPHPEKQGGDSG